MCDIEKSAMYALTAFALVVAIVIQVLSIQEKFLKNAPARKRINLFITNLWDASYGEWTPLVRWISKRVDSSFNSLLGRSLISRRAVYYAICFALLWDLII